MLTYRYMNILDDNVRDIINKTQTLATKHASGPNTDNGLVTCDLDGRTCSIIVGYGDDWVVWRAPVGAIDGILSTIIGTGVAARTAAVFGSGALCTDKVKLFVDENDTATVVRATSDVSRQGRTLTEVSRLSTSLRARLYQMGRQQ